LLHLCGRWLHVGSPCMCLARGASRVSMRGVRWARE
jgi:hypothetical protein